MFTQIPDRRLMLILPLLVLATALAAFAQSSLFFTWKDGGLLFWLNQANSAPLRDTTKQHSMIVLSSRRQSISSALAWR